MHCCANNTGMSNFLVLVFANHDGILKSDRGLVNIKVLKIGTCDFLKVIDQWEYGAGSEGWNTSIDKMSMEERPF